MKYALTSFALIITLVGGFIFGAYYMYKKYNPDAIVEEVQTGDQSQVQTEELDNSGYYDENGNWKFRYNEDESGYSQSGTKVSAGGVATENIDYRITGTNFVYEDDGSYSGFHAVVTVENIGSGNLYLGKSSVFNIEDRNLEVVDSYDYVRAVPDVIAPGEKGYFYVPYGQIKTNEDSVTIEEGDLSGDVLDIENGDVTPGNINEEDNKSIDIEELQDALEGEEETTTKIEVEMPVLMTSADAASTEGSSEEGSSKSDEVKTEDSADAESLDDKEKDEAAEGESTEDADSESGDVEAEEGAEGEEEGAASSATEESTAPEEVTYAGLSLYRVHEYFILPTLDVKKCADMPRADYEITNIVYGSNDAGYFTLTGDVTNTSVNNIDYIPVTVIALDRRGNAIAVGKDSITDFYNGATKNFGVSYVLTREERSNIVQCVIYAREAVSN
ncbi:MAG: FxLYD domain-containing protein [Butyrivibrio sp.]|nr:FxLYD domain-containing protein [Butyrivibrio sp.]